MNKSILITRPKDDDTTRYLNEWSEPVKKFAEQKHCRVFDLDGKKANRKNFESYAGKQKPDFFFLNGHGSPSAVTGDQQENILVYGDNDKLCSGAILYIRSCNAGAVLADALVEKGAKACIGYAMKFGFIRTLIYTTRPLKDPMAKIFLEPSNLIATSIIKGNTVQEAHQKSIKEMSKAYFMMLASNGKFESNAVLLMLSNMRGQRVVAMEAPQYKNARTAKLRRITSERSGVDNLSLRGKI